MQKKVIGLFVLLLAGIFIFMNVASAYQSGTCSVVPRAQCNSSTGGNIVMGLYSPSNSHAQNFTYANSSSGDYPNVLCCWYPLSGAGDTSCGIGTIPDNKVVGLSSGTNAHAEIRLDTNYSNNVCYGGLRCVSTTDACSSNYPMNLFNLSQDSNSHVDSNSTSGFGVHICCGFASGSNNVAQQCTLNTASWSSSSINTGQHVRMEVIGTNCGSGSSAAAINYTVYDSSGGLVYSVTGNYPNATWTAPNVVSGNSERYYFNATVLLYGSHKQSDYVTVSQGTYTQSPQCSDYTNPTDCAADVNGANNTDPQLAVVQTENNFQYAYCNWNSTTETSGDYCSLAGNFGSSPDPTVTLPTYCDGSDCLDFSGCDIGYTLCEHVDSAQKSYYCYSGSTCPTGETPTSDGTCGKLQGGCSISACGIGAQDTCVQGTTCAKDGEGGFCNGKIIQSGNSCLNGACYQNSGSVSLTGGCGDGYALCSYGGSNFCYPGNCSDIGATAPGTANQCGLADSCASPGCYASTKENPLKGSCSGDGFCLAGVCYSPTAYKGTCIMQSSTNGSCANGGFITLNLTATWTGDKDRVPPNCVTGPPISIECPAQAQLPFFDKWWNWVATIAVLVLVYLIASLAMKNKKGNRKSKKKAKRKK